MSVTLARLTERSGRYVLDHLEREAAVPVIDGPQAQGDLLVLPHHLVLDEVHLPTQGWTAVPPEGIELLRSTTGGTPHTLVADSGTCHWAGNSVRDRTGLTLGVFRATGPVYLLHAEHGGTGIAPGTYAVRRQREGTGIIPLRASRYRRSGGGGTYGEVVTRFLAD